MSHKCRPCGVEKLTLKAMLFNHSDVRHLYAFLMQYFWCFYVTVVNWTQNKVTLKKMLFTDRRVLASPRLNTSENEHLKSKIKIHQACLPYFKKALKTKICSEVVWFMLAAYWTETFAIRWVMTSRKGSVCKECSQQCLIRERIVQLSRIWSMNRLSKIITTRTKLTESVLAVLMTHSECF